MDKCIAIIGAMDEEVDALCKELNLVPQMQSPLLAMPIYYGKWAGKEVVVVRCGVGKVNAAMATQYVIDHYKPSFIINSGVAGALSSRLRIADLVLGTSSIQHDFDVRKFGYSRGTIPSLKSSVFTGDVDLVEIAKKVAVDALGERRVHLGLIVSGDQFISSFEEKQKILSYFPKAMCAEMEGAAIAHVASINQVPHLIIRAISDQADNTAPEDFDQYLLEVISTLNSVIHKLLTQIKD